VRYSGDMSNSLSKDRALDPIRRNGISVRMLIGAGVAALLGGAVLVLFLWMIDPAAAREVRAACTGLRSSQPAASLCPGGQPCSLPVRAPDFQAVSRDGTPVKLSDYRGKVVLLNFWASWCGVCKMEKPTLDKMAHELSSDDFVVVTLASDTDWPVALVALVKSLSPMRIETKDGKPLSDPPTQAEALELYGRALPAGVPFQVHLDPPGEDSNIGKIASAWGIKAVPESFLIDRAGNIRAYFVNKRDWTSGIAETCIQSVIDE
jgi:thiol-disulfide isomerase/thioredoxin